MTQSIAAIVTTRSQYARVKTLYQRLAEHEAVNFELIVAGGALVHRFGELTDVIEDAGIEITKEINTLIEGGNPVTQAKTTGLGLLEYATSLEEIDPDIVVTTGDRFETMATIIAATYLNIPIAHLEGGELTGSIDDKIRHATTKMADYHFVSTERSKRIVQSMGEREERIFRTGCPSIDICQQIVSEQRTEYDPQTEYDGVGSNIDVSRDYIVVQYHPTPTEYQSNLQKIEELIEAYDRLDVQAFWFWPNMDAGTDKVSQAIRAYRENRDPDNVRFFINLEPHDYLTLINNASCFVGNSSVGIRECSYFGVPTVNIGERQQNRERSNNVLDVECDREAIEAGIMEQLKGGRYEQSTLYGRGNGSEQITDVLVSLDPERKQPMTPELIGEANNHQQRNE